MIDIKDPASPTNNIGPDRPLQCKSFSKIKLEVGDAKNAGRFDHYSLPGSR
jgi:hypothetical protein